MNYLRTIDGDDPLVAAASTITRRRSTSERISTNQLNQGIPALARQIFCCSLGALTRTRDR